MGSPNRTLHSQLASFDALRDAIDVALDSYTAPVEDCPARLTEAIRYSVLAPGKRLRPLLTLLACEAVGGEWKKAIPVACAVEFIHAYSLIHDDLPAMDNDDLRRGRPTSHKQFDEATAILAGDSLQMLAIEVICRDMPADKVAACCQILSQAAGRCRLVGGQTDDLAAEGRFASSLKENSSPAENPPKDPLEQLKSIHRRKTGALIEASLMLGGVAGNASSDHLRCLGSYGRSIGLAFQIVDDCLDVEATAEQLGKNTRKDCSLGKLTYPGLLGPAGSRQLAGELIRDARAAIAVLGVRGQSLDAVARFVVDRSK